MIRPMSFAVHNMLYSANMIWMANKTVTYIYTYTYAHLEHVIQRHSNVAMPHVHVGNLQANLGRQMLAVLHYSEDKVVPDMSSTVNTVPDSADILVYRLKL
jgi:hypothetical protein